MFSQDDLMFSQGDLMFSQGDLMFSQGDLISNFLMNLQIKFPVRTKNPKAIMV